MAHNIVTFLLGLNKLILLVMLILEFQGTRNDLKLESTLHIVGIVTISTRHLSHPGDASSISK